MTDFLPRQGSQLCPVCRDQRTEVKDTRPYRGGHTRRRRVCLSCSHSRFTLEVEEDIVVSTDLNPLAAKAADALNAHIAAFNRLRRAVREQTRRVKQT